MVAKKKWLDNKLPFLIGYIPINLEKKFIKSKTSKKNYYYYIFLSDEKIVIDKQESKGYLYFGIGIIFLSLFISLITWAFDLFSIILIIFGCTFFIYAFTVDRKEVVLNRKNSLFTFPNWFYGKPFTIQFSDTKAVWASSGHVSGAIGTNLMIKHPKGPKGTDISMHAGGFENAWSFMVWYMDKNRPLPPGDAFDTYRQKDFERRKSEGFPPPLYPSRFPIPEATPEQQAERNKSWRDEDYYGSSETTWY